MSRVTRLYWPVALLAALAVPAGAQTVHVVAGDGSGDFVQLQAAVDAAAAGDVILVRPQAARYDHTTIAGKSLTIVGDGAQRPLLEDLRIVELAADEVVSLRFLDIEGRSEQTPFGATQAVGLELTDDAGCVWLEDLRVAGAAGKPKLGGSEAGLAGMRVDTCACVVIVDSEIRGGEGAWSFGGSTFPGGHGMLQIDSQVALHGSAVVGGAGSREVVAPAAQGGMGLLGSGARLFASGSTLAGGDTGQQFSLPVPLPTATGLALVAGSSARTVATTVSAGGGPATAGAPLLLAGLSTYVDQADVHRAIHIPAALREGQSAVVTYSGRPGDLVLLRFSGLPAWVDLPAVKGVDHLSPPTIDLVLGFVGVSGTLDVPLVVPPLPVGVEASAGYAQPFARALGGGLRLGAPSSLLMLDTSFPAP